MIHHAQLLSGPKRKNYSMILAEVTQDHHDSKAMGC
jgi:hypothetical protein